MRGIDCNTFRALVWCPAQPSDSFIIRFAIQSTIITVCLSRLTWNKFAFTSWLRLCLNIVWERYNLVMRQTNTAHYILRINLFNSPKNVSSWLGYLSIRQTVKLRRKPLAMLMKEERLKQEGPNAVVVVSKRELSFLCPIIDQLCRTHTNTTKWNLFLPPSCVFHSQKVVKLNESLLAKGSLISAKHTEMTTSGQLPEQTQSIKLRLCLHCTL